MNICEHWSRVEWLHKTVKNPNIIIQGTHSYYSGYYDGNLVGGNPAKLIRNRFSDDEIASLLELQWWRWTDEKVEELLPLIQSAHIQQLYEASKEYDLKK